MLSELQKEREREQGRDNENEIAENLPELTRDNPRSPKILKQDKKQKTKTKSAHRHILVIQNRDKEEVLKTAGEKEG